MINKCFGVVYLCIPHPFDIISCIVTGIYLSNYYLFSFIINQTSYLKETRDTLCIGLLNNKCEMNWPSRTKIWFCCIRMSYADSHFTHIFATDKMQAWSWSKQSSTVTEIPDKSMPLQSDLQIFRKRGKLLQIHDIFLSDWSFVSDMSLNSCLYTPFVEVLTFAI